MLRVEQWFKQEISRQAAALYGRPGRRKCVSDYVLPKPTVDACLSGMSAKSWDPEMDVLLFRETLKSIVNQLYRDLQERYASAGIQHKCVAAGLQWSCLDQQYCGHGMISRALKWVPKKPGYLRPHALAVLENYFSYAEGNNHPDRLAGLRWRMGTELKKEVQRMVLDIKGGMQSRVREAKMMSSPTLGCCWSGEELPMEDVDSHTVEIGGLRFAVDVCSGETEILML